MADRKEELLAAARERLLAQEEASADTDSTTSDDSGHTMMYRGQVVRRPGSRPSRTKGDTASDAELQAALGKIRDLYHEGLITRAEAEQKRTDLLRERDARR